jgi:hypothetical protein
MKRMKMAMAKSRPGRAWCCVIAAAALSGCNVSPLDGDSEGRSDGAGSALTVGGRGNPRVVPPNARPGGSSLAEWSALWWQQMLAIPYDENPVFDTTGEDCALGAQGHVWFLAGTPGGDPVERTCAIPTGTRILFPLLNIADDNNRCPPPFTLDCSASPSLEACLTEDAHAILQADLDSLFAEVDGVPLRKHRFRQGLGEQDVPVEAGKVLLSLTGRVEVGAGEVLPLADADS